MNTTTMTPLAVVHSPRTTPEDDNWGRIESSIVLADEMPDDSLDGIEAFSHIEVVFLFHLVEESSVQRGSRHPRSNTSWPKVGIFAQRGKNRPNRLGVSVAHLVGRSGRRLIIRGLDAIDGTPVLDIKPVMRQFLPSGPIRQPAWSDELMRHYWAASDSADASAGRTG